MEKELKTQPNETITDQFFEKIRSPYAHMLNEYLRVFKKYEELKAEIKAEYPYKRFFQSELDFYDIKGKIKWEIIRRFMPPGLEKRIKKKYPALIESELMLCCLTFFKLSEKTMAMILPCKQKSIKPTVSRTKKKTGLKDLNAMFRLLDWGDD